MEKKILNLFLYNHKLKFSEIEKSLKIRSNKLAYHLKKLTKKGMLIKKKGEYSLTDISEYLIPCLSDKNSVLPVVLVLIGSRKSCFLFKRGKRPYKDLLSLPGGRILAGESVSKASERIMKEKFKIDIKFKGINSISLEHVKKSGKIIYSFLLIFVSVKARQEINLTNVEENSKKIIKSDYFLIKNNSNKEININTIYSKI